ncbi:MAG TPA: response regulator transcription factor [Pseudolabrys sp.]|jgi:DNA-binding NarL/FixJ family response regulator
MKLLIVDDHPMVRAGVAAMLELSEDNGSVLTAKNVPQALELIRDHSDLDLVLLDIVMPGIDGISAMRDFGRLRPDLPVILLAASEDPDDIRRGLAAGALGYVPKSASADTLRSAIQLVLSGEIYVPPVMVHGGSAPPSRRPAIPLTERQTAVLKLLDQKLSNKGIGRELNVSERTVKAHITAIFKSFGVANRLDAVDYARRAGLV